MLAPFLIQGAFPGDARAPRIIDQSPATGDIDVTCYGVDWGAGTAQEWGN